jgi:hypothetical protein
MLEQAIVDAQALREAALKNAEQALIEKFAPQIKDAVESLLEEKQPQAKKKVSYEGQNYSLMEIDGDKATLQQEGNKPFVVEVSSLEEALLLEEAPQNPASEEKMMDPFEELPYSFQKDDEAEVEYEFTMKDFGEDTLDFGDIMDKDMPQEEPTESYDDVANEVAPEEPAAPAEEEGGLDLGGLDLQEELDENDIVSEIMNLMNEMDDSDLLEEELIVDMGEGKDGTFRTDEATLEYYKEMQHAKDAAEGKALEKEEENENLKETLKRFKLKNKQYKDAVEKLSGKLTETMLSNAKLIYSNKTLGDASLNERQKLKIVEAIAKARTPEEAKNLCEALNATVTSGSETRSPRTLSESVQRKSNLSGILPRRNKQGNESETHTFADQMKKLAGIK